MGVYYRFHNTTNAKGETLDQYEAKAKNQDDFILDFFKENPNQYFAPSFIWGSLGMKCPLTSVRRSITNLQKAGHLTKSGTLTMGIYGRPEHTWTYVKKPYQSRLI